MRTNKPQKIGIITRREYNWLKTFKTLEPQEQAKIDEFEKAQIIKSSNVIKPEEKKEVKQPKKILITKRVLWAYFKQFYFQETGNHFKETSESIKNIEPIIKYFAYEDDFFDCENLVKEFNDPSFKKGLLIVGKFGNGKTSIMRTLGRMFNYFQMPMKFRSVNAHDLVTEWESIENQGDKYLFFERYTCKSLYIDDVKKERQASNFGKTEIVKDILEKRYDRKLITHITCNYRETDHVGNLNDALQEFNRYGNHIYDRLFQMFNIVEFKGKSFRR